MLLEQNNERLIVAVNEIFKDGDNLSAPITGTVLAGTPLRLGIINAVSQTDSGGAVDATNKTFDVSQPTGGIGNKASHTSVKLTGVWRVQVAGALAGFGTPVYIKADGTLTATATGAFLWGAAIRAKGTGTGDALVKILQPGQVTASA